MIAVVSLEKIYKEVAKGMLKELVKYLEGKEIVVMIDNETRIKIKFEKLKIKD